MDRQPSYFYTMVDDSISRELRFFKLLVTNFPDTSKSSIRRVRLLCLVAECTYLFWFNSLAKSSVGKCQAYVALCPWILSDFEYWDLNCQTVLRQMFQDPTNDAVGLTPEEVRERVNELQRTDRTRWSADYLKLLSAKAMVDRRRYKEERKERRRENERRQSEGLPPLPMVKKARKPFTDEELQSVGYYGDQSKVEKRRILDEEELRRVEEHLKAKKRRVMDDEDRDEYMSIEVFCRDRTQPIPVHEDSDDPELLDWLAERQKAHTALRSIDPNPIKETNDAFDKHPCDYCGAGWHTARECRERKFDVNESACMDGRPLDSDDEDYLPMEKHNTYYGVAWTIGKITSVLD